MQKLKYLTILITLFFAGAALAYDVTFSLGNLCEYVGKIQTDENGATNTCSFNPYLAGSIDYSVTPQFLLSPEIGFSMPKHGRDENISKMTIFALADTKYKMDLVHFIGGMGFFFTRLSAGGGSEDLNNGNTTSSFPLPEGAVYSSNFIVNAGLGVDFTRSISADLHTYIFNLLSKDDRAFSLLINGAYHFGEF